MVKVDDECFVVFGGLFFVKKEDVMDGFEGGLLWVDWGEERLESGCGEGFEVVGDFGGVV